MPEPTVQQVIRNTHKIIENLAADIEVAFGHDDLVTDETMTAVRELLADAKNDLYEMEDGDG